MRPINNNYLSVDSKDIVDKHDHPRAMYKWSNKENQKRMINPILVLHMDPIHHGMRKVPSSIKLMSIHKDKWLGYIVMPIHNVYSLFRVVLQCLHWEIYMIPNNIGYKHIHGVIEYRMRMSFYLFLWKTMHDLKHWEKEYNQIYLTNYNHDKA